MNCKKKVFKDITSDCTNQVLAGIEQVVYIMSRTDIATVTTDTDNENKITNFTLASGAKAYKVTGQKQNLVCGFDRVKSDTRGDMFTHYFRFEGYEFDSESNENISEMEDCVIVVCRKDRKNDDGTFLVFGLGTGLFYSSDTYRSNSEGGVRVLEMQTDDNQLESDPYKTLVVTDYAGTKTFLDGLCETK